MQGRPGMAVGGRPIRGKAIGSMVIRGSGPTGAHKAMQGSWKTPIERVSFPFGAATSRTLQVPATCQSATKFCRFSFVREIILIWILIFDFVVVKCFLLL